MTMILLESEGSLNALTTWIDCMYEHFMQQNKRILDSEEAQKSHTTSSGLKYMPKDFLLEEGLLIPALLKKKFWTQLDTFSSKLLKFHWDETFPLQDKQLKFHFKVDERDLQLINQMFIVCGENPTWKSEKQTWLKNVRE